MRKLVQVIMVLVLVFTLLVLPIQQGKVSAAPLKSSWKWYNRQAAVDYARRWVKSRNPAWWNYKPDQGGDCTNFVSQALNAGGIPEDKAGSVQWYWDNNNVPSVSSSRSSSWSGVGEFYSYLIANKNGNGTNGPIADVNVAREKMEIGDVIQFDWKNNGSWDHTAIVVKTEWQKPYWWAWWKDLKIWVNYHDTDTSDKSLDDLLPGNRARYIKIWGYNAP